MTVLIVDDEHLGRERIRRLLTGRPGILVHLAADGEEAIRAIRAAPPDLVFLDVQMPHLDGFEVVERVGVNAMPLTVFVTAFDEYALRAFEAHALDYLLKPFGDDRFEAVLARAERRIREQQASHLGEAYTRLVETHRGGHTPRLSGTGPLERFPVRRGGRVLLVRAEEIDWVEADGPYALLHVGRQRHAVRIAMRELDDRLDSQRFIRIHRSTIVNLDRVRELRDMGRGEYEAVLHDGTALKLSRSRRAHLEQRLGLSL